MKLKVSPLFQIPMQSLPFLSPFALDPKNAKVFDPCAVKSFEIRPLSLPSVRVEMKAKIPGENILHLTGQIDRMLLVGISHDRVNCSFI